MKPSAVGQEQLRHDRVTHHIAGRSGGLQVESHVPGERDDEQDRGDQHHDQAGGAVRERGDQGADDGEDENGEKHQRGLQDAGLTGSSDRIGRASGTPPGVGVLGTR
jgi:hypothetical protein